jgi:hypothetical protein
MGHSQSVVIDYLYVARLGYVVRPLEAQAPLLVDPDTELPLPITTQRFEMVAWQAHQVGSVASAK